VKVLEEVKPGGLCYDESNQKTPKDVREIDDVCRVADLKKAHQLPAEALLV